MICDLNLTQINIKFNLKPVVVIQINTLDGIFFVEQGDIKLIHHHYFN